MKKILVAMLTMSAITLLNPIMAHAEWRQDSKGWWYAENGSYSTDCWEEIDGKWYHFDYWGYMDENKIIDGYYVDANGVWTDGSGEVAEYMNVLNKPQLLKYKYNMNIFDQSIINPSNFTLSASLIDMDGDGTYEAVVHNETCHADTKVTVLTYKDGEVKLAGDAPGYDYYYANNKKELLTSTMHFGHIGGGIYRLEDGKLKQTHSFEVVNSNRLSFTIDNKQVSQKESNDFFKAYGEAGRIYVIE